MQPDHPPRSTHVDRHVGRRVRERRIALGLTSEELAGALSITYQQLHKYERGINRVSAGRLYQIAEALQTSVDFFYAGVPTERVERPCATRERLMLETARAFGDIRDPRVRAVIGELARALAGRGEDR